MVKLIALYKKPQDISEFEKRYFGEHIPLVEKIPNLIRSEVAKITGLPGQDAKYYLITEMYFADMDKLNEGLASPEGKAAAKNLMSFAKEYTEMIIGEVK